jgi:Domain of unknown function (DUF4232)
MTSKPRLALAAATAAAGISLAGCGSGAPASPPASSGSSSPGLSATSSQSSQPSQPSPQSSVNPGGPAVPAGKGECTASQLKIAYTDNSQIRNGALDGMSKAYNVVMFTNVGSTSCVTRGYPGVAALNSAGAQIKQAVRVSGSAPLITLAPGQVASALVGANTASCTTLTSVPGLLVTAPDQRTSTQLGSAGRFCLNSLTISPLQPGNAAGLKL